MNDRFKFRYLYQDKLREVIDLDFDNEYITVRTSPQETVSTGLELKKLIQCTGIADKNGKLIYEGDILLSLATKSHIGVVCWDKEKAYFKINGKGIAYNALQTFCSKNAFEVIGNIYENPELLEEQCANQLNKG